MDENYLKNYQTRTVMIVGKAAIKKPGTSIYPIFDTCQALHSALFVQ